MSSSSNTMPSNSTLPPTPVPLPSKTVLMPLNMVESFMCGGLAGCAAVTVSNIPETMKTRLQLQGELQRADSTAPKVYRNVFDVFAKTWRNEGIRGLQRGLVPAYGYQILLNGSRLGFYEPIRKSFNRLIGRRPEEGLVSTALAAGAATGCIGAALGSPLFLVKARIQAYSPALPVGAQHNYRGSWDALSTILRNDGVLGLWRGVNSAILRTAMGSSVQLPSYNLGKSLLVKNGWKDNSMTTYLVASSVSGVCVCAAMQPADTVLTRMYNRSCVGLSDLIVVLGTDPGKMSENTTKDAVTGRVRGALYSNPIDCLWQTFRTEGIAGLYKGTTAHFLRIFPHTMVTLVANEVIMTGYRRFRE